MTFTPEQIAHLTAPLHKAHVKERTQAGRALSYIEAWWAIAEANRIFGFDGWNRETVDITQLGDGRQVNGKWRVGYRAKVRITVGSIVREGCGFGSGIDNDLDQAHESALKEAESDAMKRAFMTFGNPFGLALYDKTQAQVTSAKPAPQVEGVVTGKQLQDAQATGRKIPAQAKRDGDHDRYRSMIDNASEDELAELIATFDEWTAEAPVQWLDSLRDRMELRHEELRGQQAVGADAEDLDAAYRQTVAA